jgi:hypothetical protein
MTLNDSKEHKEQKMLLALNLHAITNRWGAVHCILCAFLQQEPFPSASFTSFSSHNRQSAFTDIVEDHSTMHLDVPVILCKPSHLGGEAIKRKVHNMANHWMT